MTAPLRLRIDLDALAANWRWFARMSASARTGAAVKADGYGLGAREVVGRLAEEGCRDFFFTTYDEIAAFGAVPDGLTFYALHGFRDGDGLRAGVVPILNTAAQVARWREVAPDLRCDVKVDTGMNRLGFGWKDFDPSILGGLQLGTLHSHLACADDVDDPLNEAQLGRFRALVAQVGPPAASLASSGGICLGGDYHFDLTRPGLGLYGGIPNAAAAGHVRPVVSVQAQILQVRDMEVGDSAGYGATWTAQRRTRLATVNIGYADGYLRGFSVPGPAKGGSASAGGETFPVAGRVSMDMTIFDIGAADLGEGDWLDMTYDLPTASAQSGLSQYELLTGLGHRYQRDYA
ncbi:alanine racemase [Pacificimonas flava]|uniref:alanine racemase n=2 Tax=Pacificimonas TaxID=1960290 RepID=A0A219B8U3_9SPHN|nr:MULTISPECIES: alanine racemase [Pacificimonas]MBZ6378163.1 alanine racemase [Pacificimonas aurantium]OWV34573.1 alanine racemase [Pacificimonas flava]